MSTVPSSLLRPTLELAVRVAREGEQANPIEPAPPALRRYLRFAKLPTPALDIARKVMDEDEGFRRRVVDHASPEQVGEAGWLWLTRGEGWEARLEDLRRESHEAEVATRENRAERDARRRLAGVEAAARKAEATADARQREAEEARAAADKERALRQEMEREVVAATELIKGLREERNGAVRQLKRVESDMAAQGADLRQARHQIRMLEAELELALAEGERGAAAPAPGVDREALVQVVGEAAVAVSRLSATLARAASLLGVEVPIGSDGAGPGEGADGKAGGRRPAPATDRPVRSPVPLPPGVFDDSVEAAQHLVRVPDVLVLVDGYNLSQAAWPELPIADQRQRLVDVLTELNARCGAEVHVVFDGADTAAAGPRSTPGARGSVRVRFSPAGVEADDVVLDLVAACPPGRPVLVASSDGRVREGARRLGANVVSARQLLSTLRR